MWSAGLAIAASVGTASAQQQRGPWAAVRGYVFDSLLTNATVPGAQVVLNGPSPRTLVADARGRFAADSLTPGQYVVTFSHPSFDGVGYTPPPRRVELRMGVWTSLYLSTTGGWGIYAKLCPDIKEDRSGVVLGALTNASTDRPIAGGEVRVEWSERVISREEGVSLRSRAARSGTDSTGRFQICGVPNNAPMLLRVRGNGVDGPPLELELLEHPVAIRMLSLDIPDSTVAVPAVAAAPVARGNAALKGIVRDDDGKPIPEAQIVVLGVSDGSRSAESGRFELNGLPGGTHTIEIRAIGFTRRREMVNLRGGITADLDVKMIRMAAVLPEIEVKVAARRSEFDRRRLGGGGGGHFITQEEIERRNPYQTEDLFRSIAGFSVTPSGGFADRVVSTRGAGGLSGGPCSPTFYIDGVKTDVDPTTGSGLPVVPSEIYGIEAYNGGASTPVEYQGQSNCGVVLIWTRRGGPRRR